MLYILEVTSKVEPTELVAICGTLDKAVFLAGKRAKEYGVILSKEEKDYLYKHYETKNSSTEGEFSIREAEINKIIE